VAVAEEEVSITVVVMEEVILHVHQEKNQYVNFPGVLLDVMETVVVSGIHLRHGKMKMIQGRREFSVAVRMGKTVVAKIANLIIG